MTDDDNAIIAGNIVIVDFKNTNLLHLLQLTPIQMKMLIASQQVISTTYKRKCGQPKDGSHWCG